MTTTAYPLAWPQGWERTPVESRKYSSVFRLEYAEALEQLYGELQRMSANNFVLSSNAALRLDGRPYADQMNAKLHDPGVAVYFRMNKRSIAMARDAYDTPRANLVSILHVVKHMRGLERHGGGRLMERAFTGFLAIEHGPHWSEVLGVPRTASIHDVDAAFRKLAASAHPDREGGSQNKMADLTHARDQAKKEISGASA